MIQNKGKRATLIICAFSLSYIISYIIDPYAEFWTGYLQRPFSDMILEWIITLIFCTIISEISLYLDGFFNRVIPWTDRPRRRLLLQMILQICAVLAVIAIFSFFFSFVDEGTKETLTPQELTNFSQWIIVSILIAFTVSVINTGGFLITNWKNTAMEAAEHKVRAAEHQRAAAEAELQALRLQLDPHFVFNNLSVLSELILEDQQLGYEYSENFAKVYRYLLVNSKKDIISLGEELKFMNAYLFLIKNRIGDGVIFDIDIDQSLLHLHLPPLTLQLFLENALKHNQTLKSRPLVIRIFSEEDTLVISNNLLPLVHKSYSAGIGLSNINSRYALLSDRVPVIEKMEEEFVVKVPLLEI